MTRRIDGVPPREWPAGLVAAASHLRAPEGHPNAAMSEGRPKAFAVLESFAVHPELAQSFFPFNGHVLYGTTLSPRQRQLLVLRVAAHRQAPYLWAQHVFTAREVGMTDEQIGRVAFGPDAPLFTPFEAALLRATDELLDDGAISDTTWAELAAELDERQLIDVIFTVGCYATVAMFMTSLDLEIDPAIAGLLNPTKETP